MAREAGADEAELKEAVAYGILAPAGRAKNFVMRLKGELQMED